MSINAALAEAYETLLGRSSVVGVGFKDEGTLLFLVSPDWQSDDLVYLMEWARARHKKAFFQLADPQPASGNIVKYEHHGALVSVQEQLKGKHSGHCLCYQGCLHFKPGQADNCEIAQALYEDCVRFSIVTPVWECPKFES